MNFDIMNTVLKINKGCFRFLSCLIIPLVFTSNISFSQVNKIRLSHYSIRQGLSQSSATCMVQDSLGFIWIGTQDGLNRFDGYNFSIYRPVQGDSTSISDNSILCLFVDRTGVLWIGTENGGLNKFNNTTDGFTSYRYNKNNPESISSNCIFSISEDKSGNLWIGTFNGLDYFDKKTSKFTRYNYNINPQSLSSDIVYTTIFDRSGRLWVGTFDGLDMYNIETEKFTRFYHTKNKNSLSSNLIYSLACDKQGNIWVGTDAGLDKLNPSTKKLVRYKNVPGNPNSISSNVINAINFDNSGNMWICTDTGGLNYFDPQSNRFTRFENKIADPEDALNKQALSFLKDKENNIWFGTGGSGVYTYNNRQGQFNIINVSFNNLNKLEENDVCSIGKDKSQNLWFGTYSTGLNKFDKNKNRFVHYSHSSSPGSISGNSINKIFTAKNGTLWMATYSGLDKYDSETDSFIHIKHNPKNINSPASNYIVTITEDKSNNLWLGYSASGIDKFDPVHNKFTHFKHNPANTQSISSDYILSLFFDNKDILWVGTDGSGLDRFNTKTGHFTHYVHHPGNPNSLGHNAVMDIYQFPEDTSGSLWIGTGGGGLNLLNTRTGEIKSFTHLNGLANDDIYGILGDGSGNLWISTNHGISEFIVRNETFRNFDVSDNLQSNEFNQGAFFKDKNGKMYFGGIDGITAFYPDSIKNSFFNPQVVFTCFKDLNNPAKNIRAVWKTENINLPYTDNIISFKFASLSYVSPSQNKFKYMLAGLNKGWVNNGTNNSVTFSDLPPGRYVLHVKGTNNDGIWSSKTASVIVIIDPPYWQTWWFRAVIVAAVVLLIFLIFKLRLRTIELQNKKLEVLVDDRTAELKTKKEELEVVNKKQNELVKLLTESEKELKELNINKDKIISVLAHDLRSPFNGLMGFSDILAHEIEQMSEDEIKEAASNVHITAGNLLKLLNNLLDWSLIQAGKIKYTPDKENLFECVETIKHLFDANAKQKSIKLINEIKDDVQVRADRDMLDIIFRNLISNAIKFTPSNGEVKISSANLNGFVEVKVSDTGVGMPEEKINTLFNFNENVSTRGTHNETGTGLGLNLCKELINKHGGSISVESSKGTGTKITFTLQRS